MKIIVGLGNPKPEYENTRHNCGFWIIDQLAQQLKVELKAKKFNGRCYQTGEYILLKPQTYMNNSGECIVAFLDYFQIPPSELLVIYDETALPVGKFRYRTQGSAGGHNGVKDIVEQLGTKNFKRLRVGIGREPNFPLRNWVLGKFTDAEKKEIEIILPPLLTSLEEWIKGKDFAQIMNFYNRKKKF